jgi:hypothetical protein
VLLHLVCLGELCERPKVARLLDPELQEVPQSSLIHAGASAAGVGAKRGCTCCVTAKLHAGRILQQYRCMLQVPRRRGVVRPARVT